MKKWRNITVFTMVGLTIFLLISNAKVNKVASAGLDLNNRRVLNIGVLLYSFEDLFMTQLKEDLQGTQ